MYHLFLFSFILSIYPSVYLFLFIYSFIYLFIHSVLSVHLTRILNHVRVFDRDNRDKRVKRT